MTGVDFRGGLAEDTELAIAEWSGGVIADMTFRNCDFRDARLQSPEFTRVHFDGCSLESVSVRGGAFRELRFSASRLFDVSLAGTRIEHVQMHDVELRAVQAEDVRVRDVAIRDSRVFTRVGIELDLEPLLIEATRIDGARISGGEWVDVKARAKYERPVDAHREILERSREVEILAVPEYGELITWFFNEHAVRETKFFQNLRQLWLERAITVEGEEASLGTVIGVELDDEGGHWGAVNPRCEERRRFTLACTSSSTAGHLCLLDHWCLLLEAIWFFDARRSYRR